MAPTILDKKKTTTDKQHKLIDGKQNRSKHTQPFNGPLSRTTWVSRYQKGKTNLHFTEARDS